AQLRHSLTTVLHRYGHAEDTDIAQAVHDICRNFGLPIDGGGVDMLVAIATDVGHPLGDLFLLGLIHLGVRIDLRGVKSSEEKTVGERGLLRPREEYFLGLADLLLPVLSGHGHGSNSVAVERMKDE